MTGVMMAATATTASAGFGGGGLLLSTTSIHGNVIGPTSFKPLASFRAKTDGVAQKAQGSTAAFLTYVNLPGGQWHTNNPITGADYEIYFDSVTNSMTGPAATWTGSTRDVWSGLGTQRTWTFGKDTSSFGNSIHVILIEIRNIMTPANTTGVITFTFSAQVDV